MFLNGYPYTDFHEMNLDFLLRSMEELKKAFASFTASNSLIFAEPLLHDLTKSYAKNTIVLDTDGNAYISIQAVPSGVQLSDSSYWLMVFNFEEYTEKANKNFTVNYLRDTTRAPQAYDIGDWIVLDDVLYKATSAIAADELLVIGTNIVHFTVEQFLKDFTTSIVQTVNQYKNDIDASELAYRQQLAQDIADTTASLQAQLDLAISGATVDSEVILARIGADGVTYPTLGDAIRTQIAWDFNLMQYSQLEIGGLDVFDGHETVVDYMIRPCDYIDTSKYNKIYIASGYTLTIYYYDKSDNSFVSHTPDIITEGFYDLDPTYNAKFTFRLSVGYTTLISVDEISHNIVVFDDSIYELLSARIKSTPYYSKFTRGWYLPASGLPSYTAATIRADDIISYSKNRRVFFDSDCTLIVYFYDTADNYQTFATYSNGVFECTAHKHYKFAMRFTDSHNISSIDELASKIYIPNMFDDECSYELNATDCYHNYENGGFDSSGNIAEIAFMIRTADFIDPKLYNKIVWDKDYTLTLFKFDSSYNHISHVDFTNGVQWLDDNYYYKFSFRKTVGYTAINNLTPLLTHVSLVYDSESLNRFSANAVGDSVTFLGDFENAINFNTGLDVKNYGLASSTIAINNTYLQDSSIVERVLGLNGNTAITDNDVWIINGGLNDVLYDSDLGALAAIGSTYDNTTIYGALQSIVEYILSLRAFPRIILASPHHTVRDGWTGHTVTIAQITQAMEDVATLYGIPFINMWKECEINRYNAQADTNPTTNDGTHPNSLGARMFALPIVVKLKELFTERYY